MKRISPCLLALVIGCGTSVSPDPGLPGGESEDPGPGPGEGPGEPPAPEACTKMDIVFVVDDSGSMSEEQSNLAANFPSFFDVIDSHVNSDGVPTDYRIAVTTTGRDVDYTIKVPPPFSLEMPMSESGDNGAFRSTSGMANPWISRGDGDPQGKFSSLAQVGTSGPSLEMPLYSLELALTERVKDGSNAGFLRDDALLAVVVLTDEDDCSRTDNNFEIESDQCDPGDSTFLDTADSLTFLDNLKGARGRWATAVIAGPNDCESSFGSAYQADRLMNFVSQTGQNGQFSSICDGDLSTALEAALENFDAACNAFPPVE
ncbi:MAG: hypothetical protein KJO07_01605 [Deltaproteobacteria bacterium]|nr:hypothetical protein [Deltaproteobacteria bacterium]